MLIVMSSDVVKHECRAGYIWLLFVILLLLFYLIYVNTLQCHILARLVMNGMLTVLHENQ